MKTYWKYKATIFDNIKYEINGLNIWDFKWEDTGEKINIKDPLYGQSYIFNVFKIQNHKNEIIFAAGEFSNCAWGIYQKESKKFDSLNNENSEKSNLFDWFKNLIHKM